MNEQVIKELLEQLKQNLKKIESAHEQVEKTVNAYEVLKEDVRHYTEELSFIVQNTRTMISQLEDIKEKFLGNISVTIIEEIKAAIRIITEQTNALASQISSVYDLVDSKSQTILSNINKRSDSIDSALGNIQNTISTLSGQVLNTLHSLRESEQSHFKVIVNQLEAQEKRLNTEFDVVRKQNMIFFSVIIFLLVVITGLLLFRGGF